MTAGLVGKLAHHFNMINCIYKKDKALCLLFTAIFDQHGFHVPDSFCKSMCGPNNPVAMKRLLRHYNVKCNDIPLDIEAIRIKIDTGEIQRGKPIHNKIKGCPDCGKFKAIIQGFGKLITQEILGREPEEWVVKRSEQCAACEHRTFLNVAEWAAGFVSKKPLPINHKPGRFDKLWCSVCKCCIEAKILVKTEQCSQGKWDE